MPTKPTAGHRVSPHDLSPEHRKRYEELKAKANADLAAGLLGPPLPADVDMANAAPFYFELRAFTKQLKDAREAAGLTVEQVAEQTGLAAADLAELEAGMMTNPPYRLLGLYAVAVGRRITLTADPPRPDVN